MFKPMLALCAAAIAIAQSPDHPRGHWTGTMELPNRTLNVAFDLDKSDKGWVGSMAIPDQNASGILLADIRSHEGQWKFRIVGPPGEPSFAGKLSADGKTLNGEVTQGGNAMALKLTYAGDPKVELPKVNPEVAKEFLGEWEGTLEGPGLRLHLKITNEGGGAKAMLTSVDQGNSQIPASSVEQKDAKITLAVKMVDGGYTGQINKEGTEIAGEWSQKGNSMPLTLKKKVTP